MKSANNSPIAINISGVKKMYRLGQIGGGTLQADLQSWWARIRGKEDPNTIIGDDQRSNGEKAPERGEHHSQRARIQGRQAICGGLHA